MANKLTVIVTVLFFLFTFSYANSELDLPQNDFVSKDDVTELPESDSKIPNILLPSQKTEPEINKPVETGTEKVESVPLTFVTFRPINRHFRQFPVFPLRRGHRCGGLRRHGMMKRFKGGEIPYGNDMIVDGENKDVDAADKGGVRQMPVKIERFHHGGERYAFGSELGRPTEMMLFPLRRHGHHHHHRHHRFHVDEDEEEKREHEHKLREHEEEEDEEEHHHHHHHHHHGGFFSKIRKFLHHF